ncbi:hypothetical protein PHAVU_003G233000 [Phaseolus vulgaris]|uniref:Uncharacterized protein n=1 Tax=Phaseolus vulgaris TaxID=3885 RepID=V7CC77_PHAVU|nr:hypothetical protein PHAVU_003G233000g [Phaseolus vulgaris]ESW27797.1 hypothetical protein PHAVU_003G233000g [Phaseolus vulgaris]
MSHRKSHSHGSIPFSWEDKPGVCKTPNSDFPLDIGMNQTLASPLPPLASNHLRSNSRRMLEIQDKKIPLPPCQLQPPRRSTSEKEKGFRWQEDPFLVAYKECTKSEKNCKVPRKNKKGVGSNFRLSKSIFSCRGANDVKDDIYVKLAPFPSLPAGRDRSLTLEDQHKRGFNYETWL